jgi:hypothetical protein
LDEEVFRGRGLRCPTFNTDSTFGTIMFGESLTLITLLDIKADVTQVVRSA